MIRRSFRIGLTLGIFAGLAVALAKLWRADSGDEAAAPPASPQPWPRLATDPAVPEAPEHALRPDPAAPAAPTPTATPPVDMAPAEPPPLEVAAPEAMPTVEEDAAAAAAVAPPTAAKPTAKKAPAKKATKKATAKKAPAAWVEPKGGVCPTAQPVKAKLSSRIFHLPGMLNYERTNPDRCYRDAEAAEADGLRAAKR